MKICLILILVINLNRIANAKEIFVEIQYSNGTIFKQDIIEYIEEGKIKMSTNCESKIQDKAIMVLGLTGTGKSTLVNYLNDVPLVCFKDPITRKWIIDIAPNAVSLPCGFLIGHGSKSETIYPAVHTPPGTDYSYVDNPGFQDTRGIAMEIANSFFRSYATESTNYFKFLLLITQPDLDLRGQQFRDTIKRFSEILGVFDEGDVKSLSKSVSIIVTRVENDGDTDEEMKLFISNKLIEILKEEKNAGHLTDNEEKVFNQIIEYKQVEIFSNPKVTGPVSDIQSKRINSLIQSMIYFSKEDAKFRVTIAPNYLQTLFDYIKDRYDIFKEDVRKILNQNMNNFVNTGVDKATKIEEVKYIESILRDVNSTSSQKVNFDTFIKNMNTNILDNKSQELLFEKKQVLDFFIQLLPISMQSLFSGEINYLNELNLEVTLINHIYFLTDMDKQETIVSNDTMIFNGCFIKSSEIMGEILKSAKVKYVNVNAFQAVYFDMSLSLENSELTLTIISPKWEVEKNININLSGTHEPPSYPKASNGIVSGASGNNGKAGLPGINGGSFVGYGYEFSNIGKLTFNLNGGHGGTGQEGGNGGDSNDGSQCFIPSSSAQCLDPNCNSRPTLASTVKTGYFDFGTKPLNGGNGGSGGIGGFGGLAGSANITQLKDHKIFVNQIGKPGNRGKDGNGGVGGKGGCHFKCTRTLYRFCGGGSGGVGLSIVSGGGGIGGLIGGIGGSIGGLFGRRFLKSVTNLPCPIEEEMWLDDFIITCDSQVNGLTPTVKNSIDQKTNIIKKDTTSQVLIDYKIALSQNGYSNSYPSFLNALDKFIL